MNSTTRIAAMGIGIVAALALAGCSSTTDPGTSGDGVTVTYLTHWGPDQTKQLEAAATALVQASSVSGLLESLLRKEGNPASACSTLGLLSTLVSKNLDGFSAKALVLTATSDLMPNRITRWRVCGIP